jgi:arginyl-tRNA synthetase
MGYRHFLDAKALDESPVEELERLYVESSKRSKEDEDWLTQAREELVKLQNGDEDNTNLWQSFVDVSLKEFQKIYDRLDIHFDMSRGESFYQPTLATTVENLVNKGIATSSEGALVVDMKEEGNDLCIVQKKDGGFNYTTTDVATIVQRVEEFQPSKIVYVTDERQQLHFRQVFSISRKLGIETTLDHVWFGLMRLPEGTIKTRDGQSKKFRLESLLDEAEKRAYDLVDELSPEMGEDQKRAVARAVGIGSVKYMDLSQNPQSLVNFSWDKAITLNGNSGPYIQYAFARTQSIFRKYHAQHDDYKRGKYLPASYEPLEKSILLLLSQYPVCVQQAAAQYKPSILADYLYRLATEFNSFFQAIHIMKSEPGLREERLSLVDSVGRVLEQGLHLLGIEAPDQV